MKAPQGRARGVAAVESFRSYVAQIAEVSMKDGFPRVHKVWCAVDCGIAVNPEVIKAQMEGGIGYGLGAVLFNELTLDEGGAVTQSNFHDYRSLRIGEMPEVAIAAALGTLTPASLAAFIPGVLRRRPEAEAVVMEGLVERLGDAGAKVATTCS